MEYYLEVTAEVNGEQVKAHRKMWLEYPEEENHNLLLEEASLIVSKLTGISKFKVEEAKHFFWNYEEFNQDKHGWLSPVSTDDVYETIFYTKEGV
ncbi:hypothetical protein [Tenacibaculum ovolyticum]|uniref:hypothetical protein n=1 Tax=Tenacibaculum ovolyticum TaxID=104270 RepID=UPI0007EDC77B|nr:hypothetical protein [Tenacibaculum ovolyticum]